jgi:hypothetical protein
MVQGTQFRKALPVLQTALAVFFGGWGLWIWNSVLSRPFWGGTGWDSTLRFHFWPWPFKFAAILNMPAFLGGGLLAWLSDYLRPGLPEWVPDLLLIPLLWYWVGAWVDKNVASEKRWILLLLFILVCATASSIPKYVGGYTGWVVFGIAIWLVAAIGMKTSATARKREAKVA